MKRILPLIIATTLGGMSSSAWSENLTEIYEQAKQNNPQLLSAEAQRDAAYEAINSAKGVSLPQVNLSGGYNIVRSDYDGANSSQLSVGVGVSQELFQRSSWISLDITEKIARQADSQYAMMQQDLIVRVSQAYFNVLRAKDSLAFIRSEKASVARQLEQTKQRFDVGLSAITDVHEAQAQYDSVLADEVLGENSLTNSFEELREITGKGYDSLDALDTSRFSASKQEQTPDELVQQAQEKNLSLLSARIGLDLAKDKIKLASSGSLPSLTLDGGFNHIREFDSDNSYYDYYDPINSLSIGLNFSMPLYTGGQVNSDTKQAEYGYIQAGENLEATYRSVTKNVRANNNNINASIGAIRAYRQTVVSARSALEATRAGFDVGTRTIVDVLDATRRVFNANSNLSNARYDYILSVLQLRQSVGTLSEQDVSDINAGLK
ncbi:outer membrane channel protein TolC [Vibrio sp. RC27]